MNILSIDFGTKNIGLAWAQTGLGVVLPYGVIKQSPIAIKELSDLITKESINQIVVGLPLGLDGQENNNTKKIREFISILQQSVIAQIYFENEAFSSAAADRMGAGGATRDEKSAMVILQSFLDKQK